MDQLRLLRAENVFYRACAAVRQSGVELQQVRGYLLQELLAVEVEKRGRLDREAAETIKELQVCKQDYQRELSRLRNQLQAREDNSPESAAVCGDEGETEGMQEKRESEREAVVKLGEDGLAGSEAGSMMEMKEGCSDGISQVEEMGSAADTQNDVEEGQQSPAVIRKRRQKCGKRSMGTRKNNRRNPVQSKSQSGELQLEHTCLHLSDMDSQELGGERPSLLKEGDRMTVNQLHDSSMEVSISKYRLNEVKEESMLGGREPVEGTLSGGIGQRQQDGGPVLGGSEEGLGEEPLSGGSKQNQQNEDSILGGNEQSQQNAGLVSGEGGQSQQDGGLVSGKGGPSQQDGGLVSGEGGQSQQDGGLVSGEGGQSQQDGGLVSGEGGQSQQDGGLVSGEGGQSQQDGRPTSGGDGQSQQGCSMEEGGGGRNSSHSVTSVVQGGETVSGESRQDGNVDDTFAKQPRTATGELDKTEPCLPPAKTKEPQRFPSQAQEGDSPETAAVCGDDGESGAIQGKRESEKESVKLGEDGLAVSEAVSMMEMKEGCSDSIRVEEVESAADTQNGVEVEEGQQSPAVIRKPRRKRGRRSKGARRNTRRNPVRSKSQNGGLQLEHTSQSCLQLSDMDSQELGGKRPRLLGEVKEGDSMAVNQLQDSSTEVPISKYYLNGVGGESVLGGSEEPLLGGIGQSQQDGGPTSVEDGQSQQGCIRENPVVGEGGQDNVTAVVQGGEAFSGESWQDGNVDVTFAKQPPTATGELDESEPFLPPAKTKKQTAKKRTGRRGRPPSKRKCDGNGAETPPERSSDVTTVSATAEIRLHSDPAWSAAQPQTEEGTSRGREASPEIPLQNRASESVPPVKHPVSGPFHLSTTMNPTDRLQEKAQLFASQDTTLVPTTKRRKTLPCKRAKDSSQLSIVDTKATPTRRTTVRVNTRGFVAPKLKSLKRNC